MFSSNRIHKTAKKILFEILRNPYNIIKGKMQNMTIVMKQRVEIKDLKNVNSQNIKLILIPTLFKLSWLCWINFDLIGSYQSDTNLILSHWLLVCLRDFHSVSSRSKHLKVAAVKERDVIIDFWDILSKDLNPNLSQDLNLNLSR